MLNIFFGDMPEAIYNNTVVMKELTLVAGLYV